MKNSIIADLHLHSHYSDGEDSPMQLIKKCRQRELEVISLTDHDTTDGVKEMITLGKKEGIHCLSGIELSTFFGTEIHILGYNFDIDNAAFKQKLKVIKQHRVHRIKRITEKLKELGIDISEQEIYLQAGISSSVGRVHIAKVLVSKKIMPSVKDAFDKLLSVGKAAYVPSCRIETKQAIDLIKEAGGKTVLAHPFIIDIRFDKLLSLIMQLKQWGIDGIESAYYTHNNFESNFLKETAKKLDLISTCGSDYHGSIRAASTISRFELSAEDYNKLKRR
ncbi:MAG: PHP domain-containing protein [Clostridia bacterium]|nr:PHP domain-containing protein [Clostridia bacterium]